jgi:ubiquinone/menaquinone biosynthesis C-methylase UbiE
VDQPETLHRLTGLVNGYYVSQAICVVARLGIADQLRDGPKYVGQLALATKTHARSLHRLLRLLAGLGIFAEDADGCWRLTEIAELLRSDTPGSLRATACSSGMTFVAFGELLHSVQTGRPGFDKAFGMPLFAYLAAHPDEAMTFDEGLAGFREQAGAAMLQVCDFSAVEQVVDVGGGTGTLLVALLAEYPALKATLLDLPHVVEQARARLAAAGIGDRINLVGGDFFTSVPAGGDVYLLRHVIHDWNDDQAIEILRNCRRAMRKTSKLLLVESVVEPGDQPSLAKSYDLIMLALTGGMERTEQEYHDLLSASGFALERIVATTAGIHVIEAAPQMSEGSEPIIVPSAMGSSVSGRCRSTPW